jgi:hypothetical protein
MEIITTECVQYLNYPQKIITANNQNMMERQDGKHEWTNMLTEFWTGKLQIRSLKEPSSIQREASIMKGVRLWSG